MSDLAPFVAATIRDKVVMDLKEENDKLREQLRQRWAIEISGAEGTPVYATGQFDQGEAKDTFWVINLSEVQPCPLSALEDVQITVGGIMKAVLGNDSVFDSMFDADDEDHDNGKCVNFYFAGGVNLWLRIIINGWPRERWEEVADDDDLDLREVFDYLTTTVAAEQPSNKMVSFREISFHLSTVRGAMQSLSVEETLQQESEENREFREVFIEVGTRMRAVGYEGTSFVFLPQLQEVVNALLDLGIARWEALNDGSIDRIINIHQNTRDNTEPGEGFQDVVRRMAETVEDAQMED